MERQETKQITIFENDEFGSVRTIEEGQELLLAEVRVSCRDLDENKGEV